MKARLAYLLYSIRSSLWFVPATMTLGAIALSQASLAIDATVPAGWFESWGWLFQVGPEGSRLFMSTIAGSMMTVTSLVFSLTLIALTMASSQFGPRLLTSFTRDRGNQIVLGTFVSTFVFALLVLRTIVRTDQETFVPHLSMTVALVLAMTSFGLLIYFIHHVSNSIQADSIIANVGEELDRSIETVFREMEEDGAAADVELPTREDFEAQASAVRSRSTGYIQAIDHDSLVALAADREAVIWLPRRAGHFVAEDQRVALVSPARSADDMSQEILTAIVVGRKRTMTQDVEFALASMVEVALRAISPGINDPHTALVCIDYISAALARATRRGLPPPALLDEDGVVRVITDPITYDGLVGAAFDEIRQYGQDHVAVAIRLVEALSTIAEFTRLPAQRQVVRNHAEMIERACRRGVAEPNDRADIENRLESLAIALAAD